MVGPNLLISSIHDGVLDPSCCFKAISVGTTPISTSFRICEGAPMDLQEGDVLASLMPQMKARVAHLTLMGCLDGCVTPNQRLRKLLPDRYKGILVL